jgi:carbonic anhydrase/acetyltransferase-like protein (isoleucine patch superfamily)
MRFVGHMAILHACTVRGRGIPVGMGAIAMDGFAHRRGAMLAAGAAAQLRARRIPAAWKLWVGSGRRARLRAIGDQELAAMGRQTALYAIWSRRHAGGFKFRFRRGT